MQAKNREHKVSTGRAIAMSNLDAVINAHLHKVNLENDLAIADDRFLKCMDNLTSEEFTAYCEWLHERSIQNG